PEHFGVFYLKHHYMEQVFDFQDACNQVVGRLSPEVRDHPDELFQRAERLLEPYGVITTIPRRDQISNRFLSDERRSLGGAAFVLPAIFLVVAALVLGVLMSRIIDQQRTIIGTLKALGYGNTPIVLHFLKFGAFVGLAGGILGCLLGAWMAVGMN